MTRKRHSARALLAAVLLCVSAAAVACPICLGAGQDTKAEQLAHAQQAVLAVPTADPNRFRVVEVLRGERPSSGTVEGGYPRSGPATDASVSKVQTLLLLRSDPLPGWVVLGAAGTQHAAWLRKLAVGRHADEFGEQEWRTRIGLVVPYLEHRQPLVADRKSVV